jgi:Zn-dependent metalloprotease
MRLSGYQAVTGLLVLTLFLSMGPACSRVKQTHGQADVQTALQEFEKQYDGGWIKRLSSDQQRVTDLVGGRTKTYPGEPTQKAMQFLGENIGLLGPGFKISDLTVIDADVTKFGVYVELQQVFTRLPVENGRVKVNFDREGRMVHFISSYAPTANAEDKVTLEKNKAAQISIDEFLRITPIYYTKDDEQNQAMGVIVSRDRARVKPRGDVEDIFFVRNERLRRAYKIVIDGEYPFGIKEFVIDANTGEVLHTNNFVYSAFDGMSRPSNHHPEPTSSPNDSSTDGQGQVFIPNPANSLNKPLNPYEPLSYYNPNPYYTKVLPGLQTASGVAKLEGPYVIVRDIDPPDVPPPTGANAFEFIYEYDNPSFEEVMVYYHINRNQLYIQSLGLGDIAKYPVIVDAHACDGADQSQYISNPPAGKPPHLAFGDGNVNDAEDADIILHEYGHVIQYSQAEDAFAGDGQPKAMGEGFGDYWAFSSFYKETCASGHTLHYIGEWDRAPRYLRSINEEVTFANYDPNTTPHINGRIWSRTLFEIFRKFGKEVADSLILQSHFDIPHNPTFVQGADSIIAADVYLYGGAHRDQLCKVFRLRRIYTETDCSYPASLPGYIELCTD